MDISSSRVDGNLTIALSGRLDSTSAGEFDKALWDDLQNEPDTLTIDMSQLDFISSKGLRVLVAAKKKLGGKTINLVGANDDIKEVFRISGLLKIFDMK